jgi:hypothetical protein
MKQNGFFLPLTLLLTCTTGVAGQQLPPLIPGLTSNTPAPVPTTAFGHPGDYRIEGLIAGAVLIGGAATFLVVGVCGSSDSCESSDAILISLGSIALGALTGALIGGAIPKAPPTSSTEAALPQRADEGLRPGCPPGVALTGVAGSVCRSLTHVAVGGMMPAARAPSR